MAEETVGQEAFSPVDLSSLGSFDFAPSWASGEKIVARAPREERPPRDENRRDRPRRDFGDRPQGDRPRRDFGDRPQGDRPRRDFGDRPQGDRPRRDFGDRPQGERPRGNARAPFQKRPFVKALEADVRVLPAQKELGGIIRKIQSTYLAYPLKQVAHLFLDNPSACMLRVTPKDPEVQFHVCKACGFAAFTAEALERHIFDEHMKDYFETEEKSDVPGGPVTHVVYRIKGAAEVAGMSRIVAEEEFRKTYLPQLASVSKSADMTAEKALASQDLPLLFACRDALRRERQFPGSLFFALRGAFHHRKLTFFRANDPRGPEFVCAAKPAPLDCAHAIPELVEVVSYVESHPGCFRSQLTAEQQKHVGWLAEKGHLVCYFNGQLAVPATNPKYRFVQPKKAAEAPAAEVPAAEAPAAEAPAAEAPAAEAPAAEAPAAEAPAAEAPATEASAAEAPAAEAPTAEAPATPEAAS